jgi:hypothetical protein
LNKKGLLILLALAFVLSACGANQIADIVTNGDTQNNVQENNEPDANVNEPDAEVEPEATPLVSDAEVQPEEATPLVPDAEVQPEEAPPTELDQDELSEKWMIPLEVETSLYAMCEGGLGLAEGLQIEETGIELVGMSLEMFVLMLGGFEEGLDATEESGEVIAFKDMIDQDLASVSAIIVDWANDETTFAEVIPLFRELCPQMKANTQLVIDAAREDGLSNETLVEIFGEEVLELFGSE